MNNKTIVELAFVGCEELCRFRSSLKLCGSPRSNMILLDLYNSSHPTQPSFNNFQLADNRKTRRFLAKENCTMEKKSIVRLSNR